MSWGKILYVFSFLIAFAIILGFVSAAHSEDAKDDLSKIQLFEQPMYCTDAQERLYSLQGKDWRVLSTHVHKDGNVSTLWKQGYTGTLVFTITIHDIICVLGVGVSEPDFNT